MYAESELELFMTTLMQVPSGDEVAGRYPARSKVRELLCFL